MLSVYWWVTKCQCHKGLWGLFGLSTNPLVVGSVVAPQKICPCPFFGNRDYLLNIVKG